MTRINCVPPQSLCQQHLIAEYRELPRVFRLAEKAVDRGDCPYAKGTPSQYTLGKGHIKFFYSRLQYLIDRQHDLVAEMKRRGITVNFEAPTRDNFRGIPDGWFGNWTPDANAIRINEERIQIRMPKNAKFFKEA